MKKQLTPVLFVWALSMTAHSLVQPSSTIAFISTFVAAMFTFMVCHTLVRSRGRARIVISVAYALLTLMVCGLSLFALDGQTHPIYRADVWAFIVAFAVAGIVQIAMFFRTPARTDDPGVQSLPELPKPGDVSGSRTAPLSVVRD